jgi:predicted transcriptional regulator
MTDSTDSAAPPANGLSEHQETMLFAIWKLRAIGNNAVNEDQLKRELADQPAVALSSTLDQLRTLGFVDITTNSEQKNISITPLGVAILRKVEEDRLQEIK